MANTFNLTEEEKNRIRGLHETYKSTHGGLIKEQPELPEEEEVIDFEMAEQEDEGMFDDEGNPIEVETEMVTLGEIDDEYSGEAMSDEVMEEEDEGMVDDEGNPIEVESETITLGEQDEKEELKPGAIVSIRKEYRVQLGGTGYKLVPYLQYKYNKQAQKHVPGSAYIGLKVSQNNTYSNSFDGLGTYQGSDPNKIDIYNTDRGLTEALYETARRSKEKMPSSATKLMVDYFTGVASKAGLGININSAFGPNWKKQDDTQWVYYAAQFVKGSRLTQDGAKGKYVSAKREWAPRDSGIKGRPNGWNIDYYPKGKQQVNVRFDTRGDVSDKWGKWFKLVMGVQRRQEMYEFCQIIPPGLKKSRDWKKSSAWKGNNQGVALNC